MKGDFTRFTFDPGKHYDSVLMQQGRVQTDADWNEQVMIAAHRNRIEMLDIIGNTGAPQDLLAGGMGAFLAYYGPDANNINQLFINHGRYYVDGLMVESEAPLQYDKQPGAVLPPAQGAGAYLVYLDIWKRHITSLEDPNIREVALAGADSGTRSQLVWQARVERIGDLGTNLATIDPSEYGVAWQPAGTASTGALDARAGSTPLENQLYRVEVHRGGNANTASFKWSRDNGTVVARVTTYSPPVLASVVRNGSTVQVWQFNVTVDQTGRDSFSSFLPGHRVELGNEEFVLQRRPGVFGEITSVVGDVLNLEVPANSALLTSTDADVNPLAGTDSTVRRWDNTWNPDLATTTLLDVGPDFTQGDRLLLERDITVRFATTRNAQPCFYRTGDYWLIPARTVSGLEGWAVGEQQPPGGEPHYYAPLALAKFQVNGTIANPATDLRDMRDVFPTLRSLVGGTGSIVQGTGTLNRIPKWQGTGSSVLINSNLTDDGNTLTVGGTGFTVTPAATLNSTLKVGTAGDSQTITKFSNGALDTAGNQVVPTSQAVAAYITARGFGSGTANRVARWTSANTIGNTRIVDDNSTAVKVEANTEVTGSLKVGTAGTAATITRFTASAIQSMTAQDLTDTVPTSQAVKNFVNLTVPPGTVMAYASETVPEGWVECNGTMLDGAPGGAYRNLFLAIGKGFGAGNGSTNSFNVPDLRGRFIRGWSHSSGWDPDAGSRTNSAGGRTGDRVGSYQDDTNRLHNHSFQASGSVSYLNQSHDHWMAAFESWHHRPENQPPPAGTQHWRYASGTRYFWVDWRNYTDLASTSHSHTLTFFSQLTGNSGGSESRPKNAYLMFIIKL
ncbi:DUF6519 domain-containing protein [Pyxidicoccus sp. 3LG]